MKLPVCIGLCLAAPLSTPLPGAELTGNLVVGGGMEQWRTVKPSMTSWWEHLTRQKGCSLSRDARMNLLMPTVLSQCSGCKTMQLETADVHSGKRALRLKGGIYLRVPANSGSRPRDGDVYVVRFWVKGSGRAQIYAHVAGDARAETLEIKGKPHPGRWSMIQQRIQVAGRAPKAIAFRLVTWDAIVVDDVFVGRVIRPGERKLDEVPGDCQQRVAFAAEAVGRITLDGQLDEPAWGKAVPFSGFRSHGDQTLLAAVQPDFRVLFDAQNLYFGVEIPLANARQVLDVLRGRPMLDGSGKPRPKTDIYTSRDSIELFLQAPGQSGYRQLVASLDGYRYDSVGEEKTWNGRWNFAVHAVDDRWFLEIEVPVRDLGIERVAPAEGWRLNLCCNQQGGSSTWAAVGPAFHNTAGFGKLIAQDFATWRKRQPKLLTRKKVAILRAAGSHAALYSDRLAAIGAAALAPAGRSDQLQDWQAITRAYSQMDFIGYAYRCVEEEVRYRGFFQTP